MAVLLIGLVLAGAVLALAPDPTTGSEAGSNLPSDAESALADEALAQLPQANDSPAFVVYSSDDTLTDADLAVIAERSDALGEKLDAEISPPIPSTDRAVALVAVPVASGLPAVENDRIVSTIRDIASADLPEGLSAQVTGAPAVFADLGEVFDGADVRLLIATASVVAVLLIVTYRSPWLWIVPLAVIGIGDRVAAKVVDSFSAWFGFPVDGSTTGITSVLVFGAGTNYALLLIARYREELRRHESRHEAMRGAVGAASPAILSSSGTVILGLLALLVADSPFVSRIGISGAIGIAVAVLFALVVLPAAMSLPGRWLFWPFVPRHGDEDPSHRGWWYRVGRTVTTRPWPVLVVALTLLVVMAAGVLSLRTGLGQDEQFLDTPESITAQETLSAAFPAGTSSPTRIATSEDEVDAVVSAARESPGVESATPGQSTSEVAEVTVILEAEPESDDAIDDIRALRGAVHEVDPDALVGGPDAQALDERTAAGHDRALVIPIVLVVVLTMLLVVLRSIVAAVLLTSSTVLSYLSALGVGWWLFDGVFGWSAMDVSTPLLAFIFLVALGVDYNIFLTVRAREEMRATGDATESIVTALAVTGGVITSAGILLAAVFTVLGVLPLVLLAQLGVIVGFGVLLDTVVVRSIVTPALVRLCGRHFWWPSALSRPRHAR